MRKKLLFVINLVMLIGGALTAVLTKPANAEGSVGPCPNTFCFTGQSTCTYLLDWRCDLPPVGTCDGSGGCYES